MLRRLFGLSPAALPLAASVPAGERVYAIGDVHGRLDLLDQLLGMIEVDARARGPLPTTVVILGDLVDRGPDSAGVVERVRTLEIEGTAVRCLAGNHEEVFLSALDDDERALRMFTKIGGRETLLSYGISPEDYHTAGFDELATMTRAAVPAHHVAFLRGLEDVIVIGDYVFVHAGIRPGVALGDQHISDLRWIRRGFIDYRGAHGFVVVHGHSITPDVEILPNRIGIDTGAFESGKLSALGLEAGEQWVLQT